MKKLFSDFRDLYNNSNSVRRLVFQIYIGTATIAICLLIFMSIVSHVIDKALTQFDTVFTELIQTSAGEGAEKLMRFFSFLGNEMLVLSGAVFIIALLVKHLQKEAFIFLFMLFYGTLLTHLLKFFYQRPRPYVTEFMISTSYSFPSGHSMVSFIFYISLTYFIYRIFRKKFLGIILITFSLCIILGVGISRVYLGVHYPSDVVAGYAMGMAWISLVITADKAIDLYSNLRKIKTSLQKTD